MNVLSQIKPLPSRPDASALPKALSIDAFFDWTERQDGKYELVDGTPRLQPWVKRGHSLIVSNIDFLLQSRIDRDQFLVHQGDFAIATGENTIRYADVLVEPAGASLAARTAENAILVVEVLSESTMHVDFGCKRDEYLGLGSVETYLVVAQDMRRIWQWTRGKDREWSEEPLLVFDQGSIDIDCLGVTLCLDDIYRGVVRASGSSSAQGAEP